MSKELKYIHCKTCKASSSVAPFQVSGLCPFCNTINETSEYKGPTSRGTGLDRNFEVKSEPVSVTEVKIKSSDCECGAYKVRNAFHSNWCPAKDKDSKGV